MDAVCQELTPKMTLTNFARGVLYILGTALSTQQHTNAIDTQTFTTFIWPFFGSYEERN